MRKPSAEDFVKVARTAWGEASGEGFEGQVAVAWAIRNSSQ